MLKRKLFTVAALAGLGLSTATGFIPSTVHAASDKTMSSKKMDKKSDDQMNMGDNMKMEMNHDAQLPTDLKKAKHPKYKVGEKVTITADHMMGMKGAKATVAGVYDSPLYVVDFKDSKTNKEVKNHKYVVKSELKAEKGKKLCKGTKVTINADHMEGMKNAKGKIVKVCSGPAYAVNFTPTNGGQKYTNHKWLSQSELKKD
ncbi:YdhK family protein [Fructilactobacillus cliffordii]|uniref:YdhK family protein n=1 Tax=Fructilactobacillus cliffordii TaxID=2940299 RepID=A0A9Q8ZPM3_9LACO|nr:YdhK family protein [Fructilactobacillus cliffordii]USS89245.1 YdhK family protein [Fructilactobacillus cliffordii]